MLAVYMWAHEHTAVLLCGTLLQVSMPLLRSSRCPSSPSHPLLPLCVCVCVCRPVVCCACIRFPTTCLFSPAIVPKPDDWPIHATLSGFLSLPESLARYTHTQHDTSDSTHTNSNGASSSGSSGTNNTSSSGGTGDSANSSSSGSCQRLSTYAPPADLQAFLSAGPAPIYVGFGSMVVQDPQALMQLVLEAGQMLQDSSNEPVRLLVCSGWSGEAHAQGTAAASAAERQDGQCQQQKGVLQLEAKGGSGGQGSSRGAGAAEPAGCCPEVFFTSEVPHEFLFPR